MVKYRTVGREAPFFQGPQFAVREVMDLFNKVAEHFVLIVDSEYRLLGTVTDGDLRRALLRSSVTMDDPVTACMQRSPLAGTHGENAENETKLWRVNAPTPFLPIVDGDGRVLEVWIGRKQQSQLSTAVVLAGGMGKRLGERTRNTPKPMLKVGDRPILDRIVEKLEDAGISKIYVAVHHLAEQIESFVEERDSRAEITIVHESRALGTAGCLGLLPHDLGEEFLVMNGDVLTEIDFELLDLMHRRNRNDATIAAAQHEVQIPFGIIQHDDDGEFLGITEKPSLRHFVCAGIYYLSPLFLPLVRKDVAMDMPQLLNLGRSVGMKIGVFPLREYWIDIGRPHDFELAEKEFSKKKNESNIVD